MIPRTVELPWEEVTASGAEADAVVVRERARGFDMTAPPLLRFVLVHMGPERFRLVFTNHHILLDGWSTPILATELFLLYMQGGHDTGCRASPRTRTTWRGSPSRTAPPRRSVAPRSRRRGRAQPRRPRGRRPRPGTPKRTITELDEDHRRLTRAARRHGITLSTVLQGAWGLVLGRLLGTNDVVFGATVSGRPPELPGIEQMIGLFINTLPIRVRYRLDESLASSWNASRRSRPNSSPTTTWASPTSSARRATAARCSTR